MRRRIRCHKELSVSVGVVSSMKLNEMKPPPRILFHRLLCFFLLLAIPGVAQDGGKLQAIFSALDKNSDDSITVEEAPKQTETIRKADTDKSGGVSLNELRMWFAKNAHAKPDPDAKPFIVVGENYPEDAPVSLAQCEAAGEYSASKNGYTFLVMSGKEGEILYERYDKGWNPDKPNRLASGTKSFSGVILSAAVKDQLLTLDEPISQTLTEWKSDPKKENITIRQLLSLTSGIGPGGIGSVPTYHDAVSSAKIIANPGAKFAYGPVPYQIFGEIMTRKLEARGDLPFSDPLAYLEDRVLEPIGMEYSNWRRGDDGKPKLPSGVSITAREWAKFGKLLFDRGESEGKKLFDADAFAECQKGSKANRGYGITFWLLGNKTDAAPSLSDAYMAAGKGKQRLYIIPKKDLIVIRQGESKRFNDNEMLKSFLQ